MMNPIFDIGNGWKSPFPSIYKWLALGFQVSIIQLFLWKKCTLFPRKSSRASNHMAQHNMTLKNFLKKSCCFSRRIHWNYPPPSNSHHQDYYIFNRESLPKPSFVTVIGRGVDLTYTFPKHWKQCGHAEAWCCDRAVGSQKVKFLRSVVMWMKKIRWVAGWGS